MLFRIIWNAGKAAFSECPLCQVSTIKNSDELEFAIFCIENIAARLGADAGKVYDALAQNSDILSNYIVSGHRKRLTGTCGLKGVSGCECKSCVAAEKILPDYRDYRNVRRTSWTYA